MGRWGDLFFEGDSDLDEASYISEDADIELYNYELDEPDAENPMGCKGLKATRDHLNNDVLGNLFEEYLATKEDKFFYGKELRLFLTGRTFSNYQACYIADVELPSCSRYARRSYHRAKVHGYVPQHLYQNPGCFQILLATRKYWEDLFFEQY